MNLLAQLTREYEDSSSELKEILTGSSGQIDWNHLADLADFHRISSLVADNIQSHDFTAVPARIRHRFDAARAVHADAYLRSAQITLSLSNKLRAKNIVPVILKGLSVSERFYRPPS